MLDDVPQPLGETPSTQLFRLLLVVGNHVRTRMDARLAPTGLTTQQATALTIVEHREPAPTLGSIAQTMGTSHQNVRQIVAALERKGLVRVTIDPHDRRARRVTTTPAVAEIFGPRDAEDHDEAARWFDALSDEEQVLAVSMLRRVQERLVAEA